MPIGGKLVLKGGETLGGVKKKKKKKAKKAAEDAAEGDDGAGGGEQQQQAKGINTQGKTYEQEFEFEMARLKEGKTRTTAFGSTYRAPPPILHGYDRKVTGATASERLDLRASGKSDKFAK